MKKKYDDTKERFRVYYEKNKEQVLERSKTWDLENREKRNTISKAWRERNKEKMKEIKKSYNLANRYKVKEYNEKNKERKQKWQKEWEANNKEKVLAKYKKYRKSHPEKQLEATSLRRLRIKNGMVIKFNAIQLKDRLSVFGNNCWMCGTKANQVDHVIPLSKGGLHVLSNLRPACGKCNRVKGNKILKKAS